MPCTDQISVFEGRRSNAGLRGGQFDRGGVAYVLANGGLKRFLGSSSRADWTKACRIMFHCTALEPVSGRSDDKLKTVVDDFWAKELVSKSASALGDRAGREAAGIFLERLRRVYTTEDPARTLAGLHDRLLRIILRTTRGTSHRTSSWTVCATYCSPGSTRNRRMRPHL